MGQESRLRLDHAAIISGPLPDRRQHSPSAPVIGARSSMVGCDEGGIPNPMAEIVLIAIATLVRCIESRESSIVVRCDVTQVGYRKRIVLQSRGVRIQDRQLRPPVFASMHCDDSLFHLGAESSALFGRPNQEI